MAEPKRVTVDGIEWEKIPGYCYWNLSSEGLGSSAAVSCMHPWRIRRWVMIWWNKEDQGASWVRSVHFTRRGAMRAYARRLRETR